MVKIRILAVAAMCAVLAIGTVIPQRGVVNTALAATTPQIGPGFGLPGSGTNAAQAGKYPSIVGVGNTLHIAANTNQQAQYWTHSDTATSGNGSVSLGSTAGDTDYSEAVIGAGPDGTLYEAWIIQSKSIVVRRKPVGGNWEPAKTIHTAGFMSYLDIAVTSAGQIFVVWNEAFLYRYARSSDGGNTWTGAGVVSSKKPYKAVFVAAGGTSNTVVVAFGSGDGHAYASIWNGSAFDTSDLTPFKNSSDFFASAKPAVAPNGTIYVAFRNGSSSGGFYYTERQSDGTWPVSKLASGNIYEAPGVGVDVQGNLHYSWSSNVSGRYQPYYAFKPASGDWQGPVKVDGINDKIVANVDLAPTIGARAYGNTVFETFDGDNAAIRYQQYSGDSNGVVTPIGPSATPLLDGGATITRNNRVTLSFKDVTGAPDGVRFHWDAAPTNADAYVTYANAITVDAPAGISGNACEQHTLYVQVKKGTAVNPTPAKASISFDIAVQANVQVVNPHLIGLPAAYSLNAQVANPAENGAQNGDPSYTRESYAFLSINGRLKDCSHLATYHISGSDSSVAPATIKDDEFNGPAVLPGSSAVGNKAIGVDVTDGIGNTKTYSFTLTYDPSDTDPNTAGDDMLGLPKLTTSNNPSFTADNAKSIIRTLTFKNISVTDNLFGVKEGLPAGKQFWGVYIANTTVPTVTVDDPSLKWSAVRVPVPNDTFSVQWDLFSGLGYTGNLTNKSGDYYVFVRFLDGAGNPSVDSIKLKVTLEAGYSIPIQRLPMLLQ